MNCDQPKRSHPVLEMDGYEWDVSNLSGDTSTDRRNVVSGLNFPECSSARAPHPQGALTSVSSFQYDIVSSSEEPRSKDDSNVNNDDAFHPSIFWMIQASTSVGEYDVVPAYPHLSEIPACLDVDDIFDKIRVSKTASMEGEAVHRLQRLSPPRYLRTSGPNIPSDVSSSRLAPSSTGLDHRQVEGGDRRVGQRMLQTEGGIVIQNEPTSREPRLGESPLHLRRDEDDYYDRNLLVNRSNLECRPEPPSAAIRSHQEDQQRDYQLHTHRVIASDFPTVEVVVPTVNEGHRRSRIPEDVYHQDQQRHSGDRFRLYDRQDDNPRYVTHDGADHNHNHRRQRHNRCEVHHHPSEVKDSSYTLQSMSSGSVASGISNDRSSSCREHRSEQHHQYSSVDDRLVEVIPGTYVKLRGSAETWHAMQTGRTTRTACLSCTAMLLCIQDADMVMCPACRFISPVERDNFGGGGLGLGMVETEAIAELDRLASRRR